MESSDVQGADTACLAQASEQTGVATRQDALSKVVKSSDQEIEEHTYEQNEVTTAHGSDGHEEVDRVGDITKDMDDLALDGEPVKKKKKKKSKSSKKRRMITGFEGMPKTPGPCVQRSLTRYQSSTAMRPSHRSKLSRRKGCTPRKSAPSFRFS